MQKESVRILLYQVKPQTVVNSHLAGVLPALLHAPSVPHLSISSLVTTHLK